MEAKNAGIFKFDKLIKFESKLVGFRMDLTDARQTLTIKPIAKFLVVP